MIDLNQYDNKHIVKYLNTIYDQERGDIWIIMELCSRNSLRKMMEAAGRPLDEHEAAYVMKSILEGLVFLKQHKIVHRDIKAGNILVDDDGNVKLADFGISKAVEGSIKLQSTVGSPYWMAPELFQDNPRYGYEVDIWATGILCCELLEKHPPYANKMYLQAMKMIKEGEPYSLAGHKSEATHKPFSDACVDFVAKCLVKDQQKRATAEELLQHPFLQKATDLQHLMDNTYVQISETDGRNSLDIEATVRKSVEVEQNQNFFNENSVVRNEQVAQISNNGMNTIVKIDDEE